MSRIVIKVGSHVLTENGSIAKRRMLALVELIAALKAEDYEVILVSSGAVAATGRGKSTILVRSD